MYVYLNMYVNPKATYVYDLLNEFSIFPVCVEKFFLIFLCEKLQDF